MFRLCVVLLCALMIDWIFLGGQLAVMPLAHQAEAGASFIAGLFFA